MYDQADPCQDRKELGRPAGYKIPNWCGAGKKSQRIYDNQGRQIGSIK
jgi:hypothetical protein